MVSFKTDICDKSALLATQQITSTPNIEILHCNAEPAPDFGELFNCLQTSFSVCRHNIQRWCHQITECFFIRPANSSTQLVKFTQTEILGIIDNDRVGIRDIQTRFNYCGCNKYIKITVHKVKHHFFKLRAFHLTMTNDCTNTRTKPIYQQFNFIDIRYPVIYKESLSTAGNLVIDSVTDYLLIKNTHLSINRISVRWWCINYGEVTRTHQRKLQCTRNRCGRQSQCINIRF